MKKLAAAVMALVMLAGAAVAFDDDDWGFDDDWDEEWDFEFESEFNDDKKDHDKEVKQDEKEEKEVKQEEKEKEEVKEDKKEKDEKKDEVKQEEKEEDKKEKDEEKKVEQKKDEKKDDKDQKKDKKVEEELIYWQVDFAEGEIPEPPSYWPRDLMSALGNTEDGVTENPSLIRQRNATELGDVEIENEQYQFDDEENPTEATVSFELEEDAETRDLHIAAFTLPGPFDEDEIEEQELFDSNSGTFEGGESGELTVPLPTG